MAAHFVLTVTVFLPLFIIWLQGESISDVIFHEKMEAVQHTDRQKENWFSLAESRNRAVCGDGLCKCHNDTADCSGHDKGLHYIPQLPKSILRLNFSRNHLTNIVHNFFQNATGIQELDLFANDITNISPGAVCVLLDLRKLYLNSNARLNFSTLLPALCVPNLQHLELTECDLRKIPKDYFVNSSLGKLKVLKLYDTHIGNTKLSVFKPLRSLTFLGLANSRIKDLRTDRFDNLKYLNLNSNIMFSVPVSCSKSNTSLFPALTHLLLRGNRIWTVGNMCFPRLQVLLLSENNFVALSPNSFSQLPKLIELYLYNMRIANISWNAFSNPSLQRISLSYDAIGFGGRSVSAESFADCPQLGDLQLSHNYIGISEQRFVQLFGHLTKMQYLYIENSQMYIITRRMFSGFPLLQKLSLNRNFLSTIPDSVFAGLRHLVRVDLGANRISVVTSGMFDSAIREQLSALDLSGNPFVCSCGALWFRDWLLSDVTLFKNSWTTYSCHNEPNTLLQQFLMPEQACIFSQSVSTMIIGSVSFSVTTLLVIFGVFRFRWHLRLLLYEAFRSHGDARRRRLEIGHFEYDIFVSYDSSDLPWVRQYLMPELEGRLGLRLCDHERDFVIGRYIVDNIANSVERSKKVMMLFSSAFAQSHWCQFELSLCLRHVMDFDDEMIIVCLDDASPRELTAAMMAVLKTTTCIQWRNDPDAIASFWGRIRIALQEVMNNENVPNA